MEWKDIETAPRDGTQVIVCDNQGLVCLVRWNKNYWEGSCLYEKVIFTHDKMLKGWMLLPNQPKKKHHCYISGFECYENPEKENVFEMKLENNPFPTVYQDVLFCPLCGKKALKEK